MARDRGAPAREHERLPVDTVTARARVLSELNARQDENGFVAEADIAAVAAQCGYSEVELTGLVSFFRSFRTRPPGRHQLSVCCGTACYAKGAPVIYDRICDELDLDCDGTSRDSLVTVDQVGCVGLCAAAPVLVLDGAFVERAKSFEVPSLIERMREADALPGGTERAPRSGATPDETERARSNGAVPTERR